MSFLCQMSVGQRQNPQRRSSPICSVPELCFLVPPWSAVPFEVPPVCVFLNISQVRAVCQTLLGPSLSPLVIHYIYSSPLLNCKPSPCLTVSSRVPGRVLRTWQLNDYFQCDHHTLGIAIGNQRACVLTAPPWLCGWWKNDLQADNRLMPCASYQRGDQ